MPSSFSFCSLAKRWAFAKLTCLRLVITTTRSYLEIILAWSCFSSEEVMQVARIYQHYTAISKIITQATAPCQQPSKIEKFSL